MVSWKDEDVANVKFIEEYLKEFEEGIETNTQFKLEDKEKTKIKEALKATHDFCLNLLKEKKRTLYMHDLILMAIGFYGGYLTALDCRPQTQNANT